MSENDRAKISYSNSRETVANSRNKTEQKSFQEIFTSSEGCYFEFSWFSHESFGQKLIVYVEKFTKVCFENTIQQVRALLYFPKQGSEKFRCT